MNQSHHVLDLPVMVNDEQGILLLQDILLGSGVRNLAVGSFAQARSNILQVLESFSIYSSVAYLSATEVPSGTIDMLHDLLLIAQNNQQPLNQQLIEEYLIYHLFADIIIIEVSTPISQQPWFAILKDLVMQLNAACPIIFLYP